MWAYSQQFAILPSSGMSSTTKPVRGKKLDWIMLIGQCDMCIVEKAMGNVQWAICNVQWVMGNVKWQGQNILPSSGMSSTTKPGRGKNSLPLVKAMGNEHQAMDNG